MCRFVNNMIWCQIIMISAFLTVSWCEDNWNFPPGFMFGAGSSAYQVEGGWNESDKGESIWDRFTHTSPGNIAGGATGDFACGSYIHWEVDIDLAVELGLHFYKFSISWTRILPTGFINKISDEGKMYYHNLINGLVDKGIEPFVTLYHWDLPQSIQDLGGWTNPMIADWFADYARIVFELYGYQVKMWITINEPLVMCDLVYNTGSWAPGVQSLDHGAYLCNKNVLLAHAKAYRVYDEQFRSRYHGEISMANLLFWFEPWTEEDLDIAELARENCVGRYSHAIYSTEGGWPPSIEKAIAESSRKKGYHKSTFPSFTQEEIELVKGTFDFYALNYYSSHLVRKADDDEELYGWPLGDIPDLNAVIGWRPEWAETIAPTMHSHPEGLRRQLNWLKKQYGDIKFIVTANGYPSRSGLSDQKRVKYFQAHLKQLLLATKIDDIKVTHYTAWSLIDSFEWVDGYNTKFGLYEVNFTDALRPRTPRESASYYAGVIRTHALNFT